jgi:hypothetical protein
MPRITYREHLILSKYRQRGAGHWLPPGDAARAELRRLVGFDLLRVAAAPDADCYVITAAGRAQRYSVEGE